MRKFLLLALPLFLMAPAICLAQYKVVIKNTGKVINGRLLKEDQETIYIDSNGILMDFKKEMLDLGRMKLLNPGSTQHAEDPADKKPAEGSARVATEADRTQTAETAENSAQTGSDESESAENGLEAGELNAVKARIAELTAAIAAKQEIIDSYQDQLAGNGQTQDDDSSIRSQLEALLQAAETEQKQYQSELANLQKEQSDQQ